GDTAALPFHGAHPAPPIRNAEHTPAGGGTIATPAGATVAGSSARDAPLPFREHELSLEEYAQLCAASALEPDKTAEINARFGLDMPGVRGRIDLSWQKRLAQSPDLRKQWKTLFEDHKKKIKRS
ncbi:MAG: hypothetical protein AAGA56_30995, partial [Myxococcota bacterium]